MRTNCWRRFVAAICLLTAFTAGLVSCQTNDPEPPAFQLYILPIPQTQSPAFEENSLAYRTWLETLEISRAGLVFEHADFESIYDYKPDSLALSLTTAASHELMGFLNPDSDAALLLSKEDVLGCSLTDGAVAFVVRIHGERLLGGLHRCSSAVGSACPEMVATGRGDYAMLLISNLDQQLLDRIIAVLQ